jgi:glycosyltransferase involved in cell wall biosynthesis
MRIAIVVPGRFHALQLAGGLIRRGHEVTLFTNCPGGYVQRFEESLKDVRSCLSHGALAQAANALPSARLRAYASARLCALLGRWAARQVRPQDFDCVHCYSGVSKELLEKLDGSGTPSLLLRGSAHIRTQARLLNEESRRTGATVEGPGDWMVEREQREYQLATRILTLSSFAQQTFAAEGVSPEKVALLPLGVSAALFRATGDIVEQRLRRILSGAPLRILYVGALSMRKGCWDLVQIMERLPAGRFAWRLIGPVTPEVRSLVPALARHAELVAPQPHAELRKWYAEADLFLFPTIEDGFASVLIEAQANALPLLTTTNCAGPDLVASGQSGSILPIRDPGAFVDCLRWADGHRGAVAEMVRYLHKNNQLRTWDQVAGDFEAMAATAKRMAAPPKNLVTA